MKCRVGHVLPEACEALGTTAPASPEANPAPALEPALCQCHEYGLRDLERGFGPQIEQQRQSELSHREYAYKVALPAYLEKVRAAATAHTALLHA